jgi:hypothetical protein
MTFIHGYLLGGLLLVGIPILVHLIMRQKPRQLAFPAFRFLRQKLLVNRRKLQLQHILLLLLRMLLIALLCLALARPRVQTGKIPFTPDQEIASVLLFDTSPSMEYSVGTQTRLEEARQRARELLNEMAAGSRVAVLDTAEEPGGDDRGQEWLSFSQARTRIDNLRIRPGNWPLNRQLEHACDLLAKLGQNADAPPRFLYVFSDRTTASWDSKAASRIQVPDGVSVVYVDVGVDNPRDLSIDAVEIDPPVAAPGQPMRILATVRATGDAPGETELQCQFEGEADPDRQAVKLSKDESKIFVFEKTAPQLTSGDVQSTNQVTVRLATNDALPSNNSRYATFAVRNRRKVLTLVPDKADRPDLARVWRTALFWAPGMFEADVRTLEEADKLNPNELRSYKIVCLFETGTLSEPLWKQLASYVDQGGSLIIVPGGKEAVKSREEFNRDLAAAKVLPATLEKLIILPEKMSGDLQRGRPWAGYSGSDPITAALLKWSRTVDPDFKRPDLQPVANGYWEVKPIDDRTRKLAVYDDGAQEPAPALLERDVGAGHVIQFTVPLDGGLMEGNRLWHNYWGDSSFGLILVDLLCRHLAGESTAADLNYLCRQRFTVPLPGASFTPPFKLFGPGLSESESTLAPTADQANLEIPATLEAGNFFIRGSGKDERTAAAFSMNIRPEEFWLERVPAEEIEAVLGADSVLPVERAGSFQEMIAQRLPQAREMLPYLMLFLLLMMPVESVLANLFSRRQAGQAAK